MGEESGPIRPDVIGELARCSRGRTSNCGTCQVLCSVFVVFLSQRFVFPERGVTKTPMRKTKGGRHICFYTGQSGETWPVTSTCLRRAGKEEDPTVEAWEWWRMSVGRKECLKVWTWTWTMQGRELSFESYDVNEKSDWINPRGHNWSHQHKKNPVDPQSTFFFCTQRL